MFRSKGAAKKHEARKHGGKRSRRSLGGKGFPFPGANRIKCEKRFATRPSAARHAEEVHGKPMWPCPLADEKWCDWKFTDKHNAQRHARNAHGDQGEKEFPCPRAQEDKCFIVFSSQGNAKAHAQTKHTKFEPDGKFIPAWPKTSPHIPLRDVDGKIILDWDELPQKWQVDMPRARLQHNILNLLQPKKALLGRPYEGSLAP